MAFDRHIYSDPANHVKFEAEKNPCLRCRFMDVLLEKEFCTKGRALKLCQLWEEKK